MPINVPYIPLQIPLSISRAYLQRSLCLDPGHSNGWILIASIHGQNQNLHESIVAYTRAIRIVPQSAELHFNRGVALLHLERPGEAISEFTQSQVLDPCLQGLYCAKGDAFIKMGQLLEAEYAYCRAIFVSPSDINATLSLGKIYIGCNRLEETRTLFQSALVVHPHDARLRSNLGTLLKKMGSFNDADQEHRLAICLSPELGQAYLNYGNTSFAFDDLSQSVISFERAICLMPTTSRLHLNLAIALHRLGRFAEAECSYEEAVQMEPDFAEAQWNRGLAHLLNGNYPSGLKLYEWRFRHEDLHLKRKILNTPEWDRGVSIRKKTLFLYAEQGLGDTLQFIRFASVLERMGASVIVEVQPPLRDFLSGSLPYRFISQGEPTPSHDYHYPLMSLPYALNTTVTSIPHPESYLHPELKRVGRWTSRLGDRGSLRVGLVVSGNPRHINDRNRSIPLRAVIESLPSGCDYFLLQKEIREGDLADAIDHKNKVSVLDDISDFDDTAALCSLMDLVISVDTSVAHLSAGLGTPTWILLPWIPDWRWLMNSVSSPWYNSVRLYRQDARQNWMTVLAEVSHDLKRDPRFDS